MYYTICYISSAIEGLSREDVENIMIDTKVFNNRKNIRGVLIYVDNTFFQILEGEHSEITSLYAKIQNDTRHYGLLKVLEMNSEYSKFDRFNSRYITYNAENATSCLLNLIENNEVNISDPKLHEFITYQSKSLLNL